MIFLGNKNIIPYIGDKNPNGIFLGETLVWGGEINSPNTITIRDLFNDSLVGTFSLNNNNDFHIALILDPFYNFSSVHNTSYSFNYTTEAKYNVLNTEKIIERKFIWRRCFV